MPIYEFKCAECGTIREIIVKSGDSSEQEEMKCTSCGCEVLERVLSRVACTSSSGKGASPGVSSHTCGSGNTCATIDLPGPSS
ncbi:MAG: FmdB family zinc ribbon protein [Desulfobacterales bacterium]